MSKQYLRYFQYNVTETYNAGAALQLCTVAATAVEGDLVLERNTRPMHTAGDFTDLTVVASANTMNDTTTWRTVLGCAASPTDGNLIATFAASTAGSVHDTSNTDSVTNTDIISWEVDASVPTTGSITISEISHLWEASSGSTTLCGCNSASSLGTSGTGTGFVTMFGSRSYNTTEVYIQNICAAPGSWKNLSVGVGGTAATTVTIVCTARIDSVDGNQTVTIDQTHNDEHVADTTNTDTVAAGNILTWEWDCTAHSGTFGHDTECILSQIDQTGSTYTQCIQGGVRQIVGTSPPEYSPLSGAATSDTTESNVQHDIKMDATTSNLGASTGQNTANCTHTLRIDAVDGNQTCSTVSSPDSAFDSSNTDDVLSSEVIAIEHDGGLIRVTGVGLQVAETVGGGGGGGSHGPLLLTGLG